jgi:hypothetical protein
MRSLESGTMHQLEVDSQFVRAITNDQDANASATISKGVIQSSPQAPLVGNTKGLPNITTLGHGNDATILADIEETILLEDRAGHCLQQDRWGRVRDNTSILVKLLGEEINTKVAGLPSLSGRGDANDLAWPTLKVEDVSSADVMTWDGDGFRSATRW